MSLPGPRPQPLGVLAWPAGMLLIPEVAGASEVVEQLVAGRTPASWPDELAFFRLALAGCPDDAAAAISGCDAVATYNRAVLIGGDGVWEELATVTDRELRVLVDVARFSLGLSDDPPGYAGADELGALAGSARASGAIEVGDFDRAEAELSAAADAAAAAGSQVLAATLLLTLAELLRDQLGQARRSAQVADQALTALPITADRVLRAELQVTRALARQEVAGSDRGALLAVVADLTEATKIFREDTHPQMWALCNQHLALAYLVIPMSDDGDRIRMGVAVNSLRAALRVYGPDSDPAAWSSCQLNLANALQYLPSVHQEDNLKEAVDLYEELLQTRDAHTDPTAVARILANQGNALGHLGAFADSRERLEMARQLFISAGDHDGATTVAEVLLELEAAAVAAGSRT